GEMASAGDAAVARAQSCSAASPVCGSVRRVTTSASCLRQQVMDGDGGRTVRAPADRADPAAGELLDTPDVGAGDLGQVLGGPGLRRAQYFGRLRVPRDA